MSTNEAAEQANRSGMDPQRLVIVFYLVATLILVLFFGRLIGTLGGRLGLAFVDRQVIEGVEGWTWAGVLGAVLAIGAAVGAYLHPVSHRLSLEVASELMKVTWPSGAEVRTSTFAVVVASVVAAVLLFMIDTGAYKLMVDWLPVLWGKL